MAAFQHILFPTDFGDSSQRALELAIELSNRFDASLTLIHTFEIPPYAYSGTTFSPIDLLNPIEDFARQEFDTALVALRKRVPSAKGLLRRGIPWRAIQEAIVETHADLVVMGTHGRRGVVHAFLGSVAEKTVRMSTVPVLTVRGGTDSKP